MSRQGMIEVKSMVDRLFMVLKEDRFTLEELGVIRKTLALAIEGTDKVIARATEQLKGEARSNAGQ